jgi:hypothetical protein
MKKVKETLPTASLFSYMEEIQQEAEHYEVARQAIDKLRIATSEFYDAMRSLSKETPEELVAILATSEESADSFHDFLTTILAEREEVAVNEWTDYAGAYCKGATKIFKSLSKSKT